MVAAALPAANFTPLGAYASIHKPQRKAPSSPTDPTVVLIFGWMSAYPVHLHKYCSMYAQIYPGATIILVPSHLSIFWTPYAALRNRYADLIDVLAAHGYREGKARILAHTFSNGGAFHLVALNRALELAFPSSKPIPRSPSLLVLDSNPAAERFDRIFGAITSPIKNPITRLLVGGFVSTVFGYIWLQKHVLRRPTIVDNMMDALRLARAMPWMDKKTPRLYIYSKADSVMPWTDVDAHAQRTERDGIDVRSVCFEDSAHVSHARTHPEEYWAAIQNVWKEV
ncbi:hypothetical protein MIND_00626200 [Mycena indigotica]|uniref:Indole-diterpene biosynthesis protein PaxU n=1 Tax=Mycena indigotica TaxID=2126181 RepID=A0A8H6SU40_9AGAR|nr:uncharacterized protein MIND_00626200 [Mycena indigotica]KAF7303955.1 hypothetical protein MIND_00626200 [Mycena indigotica]